VSQESNPEFIKVQNALGDWEMKRAPLTTQQAEVGQNQALESYHKLVTEYCKDLAHPSDNDGHTVSALPATAAAETSSDSAYWRAVNKASPTSSESSTYGSAPSLTARWKPSALKVWGHRTKDALLGVGAAAGVAAVGAAAVFQQYNYQQTQYTQEVQANRMRLEQESALQAQTNYFNAATNQIRQQSFQSPYLQHPPSWHYTPDVFGGGGTFKPGY
jgi:hypothetical protein